MRNLHLLNMNSAPTAIGGTPGGYTQSHLSSLIFPFPQSKLARRCWKTSVMTEKRYSVHVNE